MTSSNGRAHPGAGLRRRVRLDRPPGPPRPATRRRRSEVAETTRRPPAPRHHQSRSHREPCPDRPKRRRKEWPRFFGWCAHTNRPGHRMGGRGYRAIRDRSMDSALPGQALELDRRCELRGDASKRPARGVRLRCAFRASGVRPRVTLGPSSGICCTPSTGNPATEHSPKSCLAISPCLSLTTCCPSAALLGRTPRKTDVAASEHTRRKAGTQSHGATAAAMPAGPPASNNVLVARQFFVALRVLAHLEGFASCQLRCKDRFASYQWLPSS